LPDDVIDNILRLITDGRDGYSFLLTNSTMFKKLKTNRALAKACEQACDVSSMFGFYVFRCRLQLAGVSFYFSCYGSMYQPERTLSHHYSLKGAVQFSMEDAVSITIHDLTTGKAIHPECYMFESCWSIGSDVRINYFTFEYSDDFVKHHGWNIGTPLIKMSIQVCNDGREFECSPIIIQSVNLSFQPDVILLNDIWIDFMYDVNLLRQHGEYDAFNIDCLGNMVPVHTSMFR